MAALTNEDYTKYKHCFNLYNRDGSGKIKCTELGIVVRSLGANPTDAMISELASKVVKSQTFTYDDLCKVMQKLKSEPGFGPTEIREAFKVFDREGQGFVSAAELRHVMTNLGEKLTEEEVDEMIRAIDMDQQGNASYEDWVSLMCAKM